MSAEDPLIELRDRLRHFAAERDWDQFHSPKNLAMALSVEVAELVEHFQWLSEDASLSLPADKSLCWIDTLCKVFKCCIVADGYVSLRLYLLDPCLLFR